MAEAAQQPQQQQQQQQQQEEEEEEEQEDEQEDEECDEDDLISPTHRQAPPPAPVSAPETPLSIRKAEQHEVSPVLADGTSMASALDLLAAYDRSSAGMQAQAQARLQAAQQMQAQADAVAEAQAQAGQLLLGATQLLRASDEFPRAWAPAMTAPGSPVTTAVPNLMARVPRAAFGSAAVAGKPGAASPAAGAASPPKGRALQEVVCLTNSKMPAGGGGDSCASPTSVPGRAPAPASRWSAKARRQAGQRQPAGTLGGGVLGARSSPLRSPGAGVRITKSAGTGRTISFNHTQ